MAALRVVKAAQGLNGTHSEWAVEHVPVLIRANARAKIERRAGENTSLEDAFEVRVSPKQVIETFAIVFVNVFRPKFETSC